QLLALASLAGVSGNAVSLLAPVFPFYLSMQMAQLASMSSKLLIMDDRSFVVLAMGCALYLVGQVGQALMAQRASRETLMLRFENLELIERLQIESERAESARGRAEEANLAKSKFLAAAATICANRCTPRNSFWRCWHAVNCPPCKARYSAMRAPPARHQRRCSTPCWTSRASRPAWWNPSARRFACSLCCTSWKTSWVAWQMPRTSCIAVAKQHWPSIPTPACWS